MVIKQVIEMGARRLVCRACGKKVMLHKHNNCKGGVVSTTLKTEVNKEMDECILNNIYIDYNHKWKEVN